MTSGDEPDDQGAQGDQGNQNQGGDDQQQPQVEKKTYDFTSYSEDGQTQYATGKAETTGEKKTFGEDEYTEVEIKENSIPEWVGRRYYIISSAAADGETKYDLYDEQGSAIGVKVTVTETA